MVLGRQGQGHPHPACLLTLPSDPAPSSLEFSLPYKAIYSLPHKYMTLVCFVNSDLHKDQGRTGWRNLNIHLK